ADRAGRSGPRRALRRENRRVRLVHAGGLARDRRGLAVRWGTVAGAAADGRDTARELSRRRAAVRRVGRRVGPVVHAALPGDRGRCAASHDCGLWHRPLARCSAPPVGPVRPRRVCRWLRHPELRGVLVLLARFSISQMDVPTRQSYVMAVVRPEERSAAAGITGVARTTGAAIAPVFAGWMFARPSLVSVPFFIAGTLKIVYDLLLYR